jgi:hypothetical protein
MDRSGATIVLALSAASAVFFLLHLRSSRVKTAPRRRGWWRR